MSGGHWNAITKTSTSCKVCVSPRRAEIEEQINNTTNNAEISRWLAKLKPPEDISRHSIQRHRHKHGFKMRVLEEGKDGKVEIKEEHLESLNDFLDLVIDKVRTGVNNGTLKPTVTEGVKAAEIKGKIKEGSKWEKELIKYFLGVSEAHGHSN